MDHTVIGTGPIYILYLPWFGE